MRKKTYKNVPTAEVAAFCQQQKVVYGATKCEGTDKGNGKSDVLVEYPSAEL